jgi:hypothetical protein
LNQLELTTSTEALFRLLLNRTKSNKQILETLDWSQKTLNNNLPILKRSLENDKRYVLIKNFSKSKEPLFLVTEPKSFGVELLPKIYTSNRSNDYPYITYNLPDPPVDRWVIIPISDLHYGADTFDLKEFKKALKYIKEHDEVLVFLPGDLIENASKESPGSSVFRQLIPPQYQKEQLIELLAPIAHKILFGIRGNHGNRSVKGHFLDPEKDICDTLKIEYFTGACYWDVICQDHKLEIISTHGTSYSSTVAGKITGLQKKNTFHSANIYTMGHVHDKQILLDYEIIRNPSTSTLELKKRYYLICGTFQGYWNSYAEEAVMPPTKVGFPKITLYCNGSSKPGDYCCTL